MVKYGINLLDETDSECSSLSEEVEQRSRRNRSLSTASVWSDLTRHADSFDDTDTTCTSADSSPGLRTPSTTPAREGLKRKTSTSSVASRHPPGAYPGDNDEAPSSPMAFMKTMFDGVSCGLFSSPNIFTPTQAEDIPLSDKNRPTSASSASTSCDRKRSECINANRDSQRESKRRRHLSNDSVPQVRTPPSRNPGVRSRGPQRPRKQRTERPRPHATSSASKSRPSPTGSRNSFTPPFSASGPFSRHGRLRKGSPASASDRPQAQGQPDHKGRPNQNARTAAPEDSLHEHKRSNLEGIYASAFCGAEWTNRERRPYCNTHFATSDDKCRPSPNSGFPKPSQFTSNGRPQCSGSTGARPSSYSSTPGSSPNTSKFHPGFGKFSAGTGSSSTSSSFAPGTSSGTNGANAFASASARGTSFSWKTGRAEANSSRTPAGGKQSNTKRSKNRSMPYSRPSYPTGTGYAQSSSTTDSTSRPSVADTSQSSKPKQPATTYKPEPELDNRPQHIKRFEAYELCWSQLAVSKVTGTNFVKVAADFPWPMFITPRSEADVIIAPIKAFILHPDFSSFTGLKGKKEIIKKQLMRYHPDKFNNVVLTWFAAGNEEEKKKARGLAEAVTKVLNDLKKSVAEEK